MEFAMTVLDKLSSSLNRRDEIPNQELARELAANRDEHGIREIVAGLSSKDTAIRADCIKVLYEIGYIDPQLVAPYALEYVKLLNSRNNRLVWGGMIALSTVAPLAADALHPHVAEIQNAFLAGSVITKDAGVLTLAGIASASQEYNREIFPFLLEHLRTCRPKDVPQHCEKALVAVNAENKVEFIAVLDKRMEDMLGSQVGRVNKVIKQAENK
jgi:hypothetical protein